MLENVAHVHVAGSAFDALGVSRQHARRHCTLSTVVSNSKLGSSEYGRRRPPCSSGGSNTVAPRHGRHKVAAVVKATRCRRWLSQNRGSDETSDRTHWSAVYTADVSRPCPGTPRLATNSQPIPIRRGTTGGKKGRRPRTFSSGGMQYRLPFVTFSCINKFLQAIFVSFA